MDSSSIAKVSIVLQVTTIVTTMELFLGAGLPITLGTTNGSHISYGVVKEIEEGNGFKQYIYTTAHDYGDYAASNQSFANNIVGSTTPTDCDISPDGYAR